MFHINNTRLKLTVKILYANDALLNSDKCKVALTARNKRIIKGDYILNGAESMIYTTTIYVCI